MRIFFPLMFPLMAVLIWATNTVVSKAAADVLDPAAISFYRWVIAALALTPFCLPQLWRRRGEIRPWLGKLLVLAALGMVLYQCLAYYAAHTTSATNMGVIGSLIPLLTLLQSALFFGQRPGKQAFHLLRGDPTRPQHLRGVDGAVDDRALHPDRARSTVEDQVHADRLVTPVGREAAEGAPHQLRRGGGHPAEPVRRRCREATAETLEQLGRERMCRHPHPDRRTSTRDDVEHVRRLRHDHRERAGPARGRQHRRRRRHLGRPVDELLTVRHVHDQWMIDRAPLGGEDPTDRGLVRRIGREPVDGLRRDGHQAAVAEHPERVGDVGRDPGRHGGSDRPGVSRGSRRGTRASRR